MYYVNKNTHDIDDNTKNPIAIFRQPSDAIDYVKGKVKKCNGFNFDTTLTVYNPEEKTNIFTTSY